MESGTVRTSGNQVTEAEQNVLSPDYSIWKHITKTRILHVQPAYAIERLSLFALDFRRGKGAQSQMAFWLELHEARVMFRLLSNWRIPPGGWEYHRGGATERGIRARRLSVLLDKADHNKLWMHFSEGEGNREPSGIVKMVGDPSVRIGIPLSRVKAVEMSVAVLEHLQAYMVVRMLWSGAMG